MPWFKHQSQLHEVRALATQQQFEVDGQTLSCQLEALDSHHYLLRQGQQQKPVFIQQQGDRYQIWYQGEYYEVQRQNRASEGTEQAHSGRIEAPLTGKVILVAAEPQAEVRQGATLVVLESMKMETALTAPFAAKVLSVHCAAGDQIANGQLLVELAALDPSAEPQA